MKNKKRDKHPDVFPVKLLNIRNREKKKNKSHKCLIIEHLKISKNKVAFNFLLDIKRQTSENMLSPQDARII